MMNSRIQSMILLQVPFNKALLLGGVGALRAAEFLVPAVHQFVGFQVTFGFVGIIAQTTAKASFFF